MLEATKWIDNSTDDQQKNSQQGFWVPSPTDFGKLKNSPPKNAKECDQFKMKFDASSNYGWVQIDADELVAELQREVGQGHVLFDAAVKGVKRCGDDVLFELTAPSQISTFENAKYAEVHLTWARNGPETPPWPETRLYASFDEWNSKFVQNDREVKGFSQNLMKPTLGMARIGWILLFLLLTLLAIATQQ